MTLDKYGRNIESIKHQISAGTIGRYKGHKFEQIISENINHIDIKKLEGAKNNEKHIFRGNPAELLLTYIINNLKLGGIKNLKSWWFGGLATARSGDILEYDGKNITASKSDIVIRITITDNKEIYVGVSIKDCNADSPTNDQVYFTTARAFCKLLRNNGLTVSDKVETALRKFCGDVGFRPADLLDSEQLKERKTDPERFFLEEVGKEELKEIIELFSANQRKITEIILKYAYEGDVFPPNFILHKITKSADKFGVDVAIYSMGELLDLSEQFSKFELKPYVIHKGSWKGDPNTHLAPQIGFIQMQRKGSKKNATQLQFNLKAGYFNFMPPEKLKMAEYLKDI